MLTLFTVLSQKFHGSFMMLWKRNIINNFFSLCSRLMSYVWLYKIDCLIYNVQWHLMQQCHIFEYVDVYHKNLSGFQKPQSMLFVLLPNGAEPEICTLSIAIARTGSIKFLETTKYDWFSPSELSLKPMQSGWCVQPIDAYLNSYDSTCFILSIVHHCITSGCNSINTQAPFCHSSPYSTKPLLRTHTKAIIEQRDNQILMWDLYLTSNVDVKRVQLEFSRIKIPMKWMMIMTIMHESFGGQCQFWHQRLLSVIFSMLNWHRSPCAAVCTPVFIPHYGNPRKDNETPWRKEQWH